MRSAGAGKMKTCKAEIRNAAPDAKGELRIRCGTQELERSDVVTGALRLDAFGLDRPAGGACLRCVGRRRNFHRRRRSDVARALLGARSGHGVGAGGRQPKDGKGANVYRAADHRHCRYRLQEECVRGHVFWAHLRQSSCPSVTRITELHSLPVSVIGRRPVMPKSGVLSGQMREKDLQRSDSPRIPHSSTNHDQAGKCRISGVLPVRATLLPGGPLLPRLW